MEWLKRYSAVFLALIFLLSSNGLYIHKHFCNEADKTYLNILQPKHCCSSGACSSDDDNCCNDSVFFIKSNIEAFVSKYNLNIETKIVDFSPPPIAFSQIISYQFSQVGDCNTFLKRFKALFYLQPDIHRLQVMLC